MIFLATLLISMMITIALTPVFKELAVRLNAMDIPGERKVHAFPMPMAGGIAMALGAIVPILFWAPRDLFLKALLIGTAIVVLTGLFDDLKTIGFKTKFVGQFAAAAVVTLYGGIQIKSLGMLLPENVLLPDWLAIPVTIFVLVGVTNAINLSDGLDGLAGGISLLSFACIAYLAFQGENFVIALLSVAMVGAILGFLRFNTFPAVLFMGDTGSQLLGFVAGTLSIALTQGSTPLSPLLPIILLGFPLLDTMTVIFERIYKGRSPFAGDKNHIHHKLMRLGLYHTEAVLVIYFLQAFLVTFAFIFRFYSEWFLLFSYMMFSGVIVFGFYVAGKTGWKLKRYHLFDNVIKGRLRILKEKNILIKFSFRTMQIGVPSLMFFTSFLITGLPRYFSFLCIALSTLMLVSLFIKREWMGSALRIAAYLSIPFLIYLSETDIATRLNGHLIKPYNLSFGFLLIFVISTLKFTRRRSGFKSTPMDFLIILIVLMVPLLPEAGIKMHHVGLIAAKIIVLLFAYEVLIEESRGQLNKLGLSTLPALLVICVRGLIG